MNNPTPIICLELTHHVDGTPEFPKFRACQHYKLCFTRTQYNAWLDTTPRGNEIISNCKVPPEFDRCVSRHVAQSASVDKTTVLVSFLKRVPLQGSQVDHAGVLQHVRDVRRHPLSELPKIWRAQLPPLPNPVGPGPGTQPVQQLLDVRWRVRHSLPDVHSDFLPSPQWHTVAWKYFDCSPFPTHATMTARVFDLAVLQEHFHSIPEFYRGIPVPNGKSTPRC